MKAVNNIKRINSVWVYASILMCAVILVSTGTAYGHEPDYEAVGARLIEAVEAEELSPEQAVAMMGALARARFMERLQAARESEREREREHESEPEPEYEPEHEESLESRFNELGLDEAVIDRLRNVLGEHEFSDRQIEITLGGMLRIIHEMQEAGEDIELDVRLLEYLREEAELTDDQIKLVWRLTQRISRSLRDEERPGLTDERLEEYRAIESRIREAIETGRIKPEEAEQKLMEIRTRMFERKEEREEQTGMENWMLDVGRRLKAAFEAGDLGEDEAWAKWQEIKQTGFIPRLKAAVERGDISEEEARAVWHRIEIAETAAKVRLAVKKGEMSEEEAKAKMQAIRDRMHGREEREEHREAEEHR
jgi:hypothetical protein